jgi:ubiquitin-activating enzyme E1
MNPGFHAIAYEQKVALETESLFNDDFYDHLHMICTALDNVEARLYLDQKCLFYRKPMLESGTLGAKGHTQVVAPGKTENYGATRDPPEKSIPVCTLKHFPNQIEHTLQWGREWFEEVFKQSAEDMVQYLHHTNDFLTQLANQPNIKYESLQRLRDSLVTHRPHTLEDCAVWARHVFEELFANRVKQLMHNFPLDRRTASGSPFWAGSKKPPTAIVFDATDPLHAEFILSVTRLRAKLYGLQGNATNGQYEMEEDAHLLAVAQQTVVEVFRPVEGVKIAATDEELKNDANNNNNSGSSSSSNLASMDIDGLCNAVIAELPSAQALQPSVTVHPIDFDKDIDAHMRVVAAASNLRARNYRIPEADLHTSRGIAGKITPAIATTTALVTGAICLELFKLLQDKPASALTNLFVNLAVPIFTSMEPEPPKYVTSLVKGQEWKWTPWDRIDINDPAMTVAGLIQFLEDEYALELSMLSSGVTILFSDFLDNKRKKVHNEYLFTLCAMN